MGERERGEREGRVRVRVRVRAGNLTKAIFFLAEALDLQHF